MRLDKFTQRAQEAILAAQELAQTYNHSQIEPEHLLLALLQQPDGVVPEVITQAGANPGVVQSTARGRPGAAVQGVRRQRPARRERLAGPRHPGCAERGRGHAR